MSQKCQIKAKNPIEQWTNQAYIIESHRKSIQIIDKWREYYKKSKCKIEILLEEIPFVYIALYPIHTLIFPAKTENSL